MKYGTNAPVLRQTNQQAIAVLEEYYKDTDTVRLDEPEPLSIGERMSKATLKRKAPEVLLRELFGPPIEEAMRVYTPQQIEDFCEKVENKCLFIPLEDADGKILFEGVQIIKQLQQQLDDEGLRR